jgi:hypothetical protein
MFKRKTGQLNHEIPMTAAMMHGNITENEAREQASQGFFVLSSQVLRPTCAWDVCKTPLNVK